ncbi:precorrin-2 C(20)-methyltransferase [Gudongella sp. SC589]|jgi:precorrin-2/cobalt-factor-2 C20-methyltransferase|uniref:precorrin-2 C(20)-methyltransferase n=1 Tax=Gudongella sp. SC589 TaxID=3385990 RepID=UPI003904E196
MRKIYFTGTGPGDPELLTRKAVRVIREADVIFVPDNRGRNMALDTIKELISGKKVCRIGFPMGEVTEYDYGKAARIILDNVPWRGSGVFVTIGDPMIYSTAIYIMGRLEGKSIELEVVPGIPSFVAAAAKAQKPLVSKGEVFSLCDYFRKDILDVSDSMAVLKTSKDKMDILDSMEDKGFWYTYVREATLPGEQITESRSEILEDQSYISMIIARRQGEDKDVRD